MNNDLGAVAGNTVQITDTDIHLIQQQRQKRYFKLTILNREWASIGEIKGQVISGTITIDSAANLRRTASITMYVDRESMEDAANFSMQNFLRIWCGIEDNVTNNVTWYSEGFFIISQHNYKFDATSRTLTMSLVDLMADLNGDRGGTLHAYSTIVKNSERISDIMVNILSMCGYTAYNITSVGAIRNISSLFDDDANNLDPSDDDDIEDFLVPYNLTFSPGVTAYEILEKLISLYPYYRMRFDTNGVFVCDRVLLDYIGGESRFRAHPDVAKILSTMTPLIDSSVLDRLIISEDKAIDWTQVKNCVEVWGKDGLYYGEAKDENPVSPFNVNSIGELRAVYSGDIYDNIYDRYKHPERVKEYQKEQARCESKLADLKARTPVSDEEKRDIRILIEETKLELQKWKASMNTDICIHGNHMAKDYADKLLYENCRINDSLNIQTIFMPFINDVDFQITHRTKLDNSIHPYIIKSVTHDLANNTSTINAMRFYRDVSSAHWVQLDAPDIVNYHVDDMTITIEVRRVQNATSYILYMDFDVVLINNDTVITYTLPNKYEGSHSFYVTAASTGYLESVYKEIITVDLEWGTGIVVGEDNTQLINIDTEKILVEK